MKHAGERLFSCPKAQWPFVLSIGLASETWLSVLALSLQPWAICLATGQNASDMAFLPHRHRLQTFSSTSLTHQKGEHVLAGLGPGTQVAVHKAFPCTGAFYMAETGAEGTQQQVSAYSDGSSEVGLGMTTSKTQRTQV